MQLLRLKDARSSLFLVVVRERNCRADVAGVLGISMPSGPIGRCELQR